jgi:hypothetical protein
MNTLIQKYGAALLPALATLLTTFQLFRQDGVIDETERGQFLILIAGLIVTYAVPLVKGRWAGALKTGAQLVAAVGMLVFPLISGGFETDALIVFALALVNALLTEIGVQARTDEPLTAEAQVIEIDEATARILSGEAAIDRQADNDDLVLDEDNDEVLNKATGERV